MEIGRKVWNMCNAIWVLQGRHRDMVYYADYVHDSGSAGYAGLQGPYYHEPVYENGIWSFKDVYGRNIDRDGFDELKTNFYEVMEWDTSTGWPTRATLEGLDLGFVADKLEAAGKLGT